MIGDALDATTKPFRAFISYSQQDSLWARRLHRWLESYRVPVGAIADVEVPVRLGKFFRDEEDMAAASDIAVQVREAITNAESLIVICSPRSAQSKWVNAEIHHFRKTGRADKVFAFIIDGVPNSGDEAAECFPPALRAAGDPRDPSALPIEPLGLDIRKDGRAKACARLAAGLLSIDFDDLWQRDRRRAELRQRLAIGSLAAIGIVFAAISAAAVRFALQSEERAAILAIDTGRARLADGHTDAALLVLLNAARQFKDDTAPHDLLIAFDEALQRAAAETVIHLPEGARVFDAPNGYYIHDPATDDLLLLDSAKPPRIVSRGVGQPFFAGDAPDGSLILVNSDLKIERRVDDRAETLGAFKSPDEPYEVDWLRRDIDALRYDKMSLFPISRDGMLTFNFQYFDLNARTLHEAKPVTGTLLAPTYVQKPNGGRVVFGESSAETPDQNDNYSVTLVAPVDAQNEVRTLKSDALAELMGYRCWGGKHVDPKTKRQFAEALDGIVAIECTQSGDFLLLSTYESMAHAPIRHDYLLDLAGGRSHGFKGADRQGSPVIQHILSDRLQNSEHTFVSGAAPERILQRELTDTALRAVTYPKEPHESYGSDEEDRILAVASLRDVLVDTRDLRFYFRLPKDALSVRFLDETSVGVLDDDSRAIRVLDFSSPHLYASRPYTEDEIAPFADEFGDGLRFEFEDFAYGDTGASIYSEQAGRTYRRLGAGYKGGLNAGLLKSGEVYVRANGFDTAIRLHTLSETVAAAKAALAPECRNFRANAFRKSGCWPAQLAE